MEYNYAKYFEKYDKTLNVNQTKHSNLKKDISFKEDTFFDILQKKKLQKTSNQNQAIIDFLISDIIPQMKWCNFIGIRKLKFKIPKELASDNIQNAHNTIIEHFKNENICIKRTGLSPYSFLVRWDKPYHALNKATKTSLDDSKKAIQNSLNYDLLYNKLRTTFNDFNIEDIDKYNNFLYTNILPQLERKSDNNLKHTTIKLPNEFKDKYSIKIIIHLLEEQNLYTYKRFMSKSKLHIALNKSYKDIKLNIDELNYCIIKKLYNLNFNLIDIKNKYVQQIINLISTLAIRIKY